MNSNVNNEFINSYIKININDVNTKNHLYQLLINKLNDIYIYQPLNTLTKPIIIINEEDIKDIDKVIDRIKRKIELLNINSYTFNLYKKQKEEI